MLTKANWAAEGRTKPAIAASKQRAPRVHAQRSLKRAQGQAAHAGVEGAHLQRQRVHNGTRHLEVRAGHGDVQVHHRQREGV